MARVLYAAGEGECDCPFRPGNARRHWLAGYRREVEQAEAWLDDFDPGWREEIGQSALARERDGA